MRCVLFPAALALLAAPAFAQNQAIALATGADAHFDIPYDPAFLPRSGLTVEAWVTYDDSTIPTGQYYWPTIARQNVAPGAESWLFRVGAANTNNRSLEWGVRQQNGGFLRINYVFAAGQFANWTHLAGTYDGSTLTIYVNGSAVLSQTFGTSPIADNGGILRVGNGDVSAPGHETWNGQLDELRIWPFARTGAEITATMNDEIIALPGGALTFNLNGAYIDSSKGLSGTPAGPIQFVPSSLPLTQRVAGALSVGPASTTCGGTPVSTFGSLPLVGNAAFELIGTEGPRSSSGTVMIAPGLATSPLPILGIQYLLQPAIVGVTAATNGLGTARVALGVPNDPALGNASLATQWIYLDPACGPQGVTSTDGMAFVIQP